MDALRVSETTGSVRAAILAALRDDRIFSPYGRHIVTIEDLDAHGTYANGMVSIGGFETRVICPSHMMGADCVLPIGHAGDHKSEWERPSGHD